MSPDAQRILVVMIALVASVWLHDLGEEAKRKREARHEGATAVVSSSSAHVEFQLRGK